MKDTVVPDAPDEYSPAGAAVRFLMNGATGNMTHCTVPPMQTNRAMVHSTVSEFWHVLSGRGEIWRKDGEESRTVLLVPGVSIDIPVGTAFQYRNIGGRDLEFICITMPPWPGDEEATEIDGFWRPSI